MGNSQNFSDTNFQKRYLQLETVSSSMAQFVDKWQRKNVQVLLIFLEKLIFLKNWAFFTDAGSMLIFYMF